ncbi:hypothetical protein [Paenibacillus sp. QZ-Y1]|uniref:hypothetical protein n=1 Tax=Paenibacillus sp. QZ-Y1 TaxID=3414511 RepID=UPI003F7A2130
MFSKFKYVAATLVVALGFSFVSPSLSYAATPQIQVSQPQVSPTQVDEPIQTMGLKKDVIVKALRYGGKALDNVLDWLGIDSAEAKYLTKNAGKIADFIEETADELEKRLLDFLIFKCDIPQGYARVITSALSAYLL